MSRAKALVKAGGEALVLKTQKDGGSCLYIACQEGHLESVKALINAGRESLLLKTQMEGLSCLHIACIQGHLETATTLVNASGGSRAAFLLMTDSVYGRSCLHAACHFGHVAIVDFLLSLSCAGLVGLRDRAGLTALEHAVALGHAGAGAILAAEAARAGPRRLGSPRPRPRVLTRRRAPTP